MSGDALTDVGHVAHGSGVEATVLAAVIDDLVVHGGVRAVGDDHLAVLESVVLVPHLA